MDFSTLYFVNNTSIVKIFLKAILSSDECQEATSYLLPTVLLSTVLF